MAQTDVRLNMAEDNMTDERIDLTMFEEMEGWRIDEGNSVYHIVKENGESVISTWNDYKNEDDCLECR